MNDTVSPICSLGLTLGLSPLLWHPQRAMILLQKGKGEAIGKSP
jgi:hypothetical protein